MQIIKEITLDLNRGISHSYIEIHQGEKDSRYLRAKITRDGEVFEIPETFSAFVDASLISSDKRLKVAENIACEINPNEGDASVVMIPITTYMSKKSGKLELNLKLNEDNSTVIAQKVYVVVIKSSNEDAIIDSDDESDNSGIADGSITTEKYADKSVTKAKLADEVLNLIEQGGGTGGITKETDPTVPEWAKREKPPTYTAEDVGAVSTNDIVNDFAVDDDGMPIIPENGVVSASLFFTLFNDLVQSWGEELGQKADKALVDFGKYFTEDTVEGALQEIGATLDGLETLLAGI